MRVNSNLFQKQSTGLEIDITMVGTSIAEYVFIRASIFFLHIIAPASCLCCLFFFFRPLLAPGFRSYTVPFPIKAWLLTEAVIFTIIFLPYRSYLQRSAIHPELHSREERGKLFERCMSNVADFEKYLSLWHLGATKENIKRENVEEFIRWAFFNIGDTKKEHEEEIEGYVTATEKLLRRKLPLGKGNAKALRLTLDKAEYLHRSLFWYLCILVVDTATCCSLWYNGFHFYRTSLSRFLMVFPPRPLTLLSTHISPADHLTYWYRPHTAKSRLPILFIHGIGVGLYPYTDFLHNINKAVHVEDHTELGIIAIEIMPVSSRLTRPALGREVMIQEIQEILKHHGWNRFILISHSYGSIIAAHLLTSPLIAPLVGPIMFVDPICFLLHLPNVAYNFTARQPKHANEYLFWYFGSKDIGVAHTLARRFFWSENILWKEDLGLQGRQEGEGRNVTVALSGRDLIVDSETVGQYLAGSSSQAPLAVDRVCGMDNGDKEVTTTNKEREDWKARPWKGSGLEILWYNHLDHGQVFDSEQSWRPLIEAIGAYSTQTSR